MTPLAYLKLAGALALAGAGAAGVLSYRHLAAKAATADERIAAAEKTAANLQAQMDTLSEEVIRRAEFDRAIRDARQRVSDNLDTAAREDPVSRDYLGEPLPDRVREAIRMRAVPPTDGD